MSQFEKGNRWWEARSTHGRRPLFADPDALFSAAMEYVEWTEANPLMEAKAFAYEGKVTLQELPKMRAMTITGLCIFLDIDETTWRDYRTKPDFSTVCTRVEAMIRQQKFTGAAADLLNPSIIARDLGLADKKELSGPDGAPVQNETTHRVDPDQLRDLLKQVNDEC